MSFTGVLDIWILSMKTFLFFQKQIFRLICWMSSASLNIYKRMLEILMHFSVPWRSLLLKTNTLRHNELIRIDIKQTTSLLCYCMSKQGEHSGNIKQASMWRKLFDELWLLWKSAHASSFRLTFLSFRKCFLNISQQAWMWHQSVGKQCNKQGIKQQKKQTCISL